MPKLPPSFDPIDPVSRGHAGGTPGDRQAGGVGLGCHPELRTRGVLPSAMPGAPAST